MRLLPLLAAISPFLLLAACNLAPNYSPPTIEIPVKYKEAGVWNEARPRDDRPRGAWWLVFNDRTLNQLEPQVESSNQDIAAALAAIDQARAFAARAEAGLFPFVELDNSLSANKESRHRPFRKSNRPQTTEGELQSLLTDRPLNEPDHFGNNLLHLQSSYEIDLWGRVRNAVAAAQAQAEATAADLESIRLSFQAELARDYIDLRGIDSEEKLLSDTIASYKQALELTKAREEGQIASPADVPRAEAQLETVRAQLADLSARRDLLEHAIATLVGKPASTFPVSPRATSISLPSFPPSVPSTLLERRPDIAAAERRVAAANQSIGIARAAFFPRVTINLAAGTQDTGLGLLNFRNSIWSVGPAVTLPIFDAGARLADLAGVEAAYAETVARYRATVLRALQEVEDNLGTLKWLRKEARNVNAVVSSTQKVLNVSLTLYRDGAVTYLDVVVAQTAALDAQRTALALKTRELQASVSLILALGGELSSSALEASIARDPHSQIIEGGI